MELCESPNIPFSILYEHFNTSKLCLIPSFEFTSMISSVSPIYPLSDNLIPDPYSFLHGHSNS